MYAAELAEAPGHPFSKLNEALDAAGFDGFCEARCQASYQERLSLLRAQLLKAKQASDGEGNSATGRMMVCGLPARPPRLGA